MRIRHFPDDRYEPVAPLADLLPHTISPYLTLMIVGFLVGTAGHVYKSRLVVGIGVAMIFLATLLLPLAVIATEEEPPSNRQILAPGTK
jgi:hypothetical protein